MYNKLEKSTHVSIGGKRMESLLNWQIKPCKQKVNK